MVSLTNRTKHGVIPIVIMYIVTCVIFTALIFALSNRIDPDKLNMDIWELTMYTILISTGFCVLLLYGFVDVLKNFRYKVEDINSYILESEYTKDKNVSIKLDEPKKWQHVLNGLYYDDPIKLMPTTGCVVKCHTGHPCMDTDIDGNPNKVVKEETLSAETYLKHVRRYVYERQAERVNCKSV